MAISSPAYFVFLAALFFLYWPATRRRTLSIALLLFANYLFLARWSLIYLGLIPLASSLDFWVGLRLSRSQSNAARRVLIGLSLILNLGLIASSKYLPFLAGIYGQATGTAAPDWHWTLPLGLSFYCFQSLTYTLDLYRRDAKPAPTWLSHLAAVSFFPTMLSGPITRVTNLVRQFSQPARALTNEQGGRALFLIGLGLAKKFLIADYLAENIVNRVFDTPGLYSGTETLLAVYGYALQLYYDFSGYTDIALGSALLLGITLPPNFNRPYTATSIADFWRRWHISLSNWLRDYLYFSLPGQRSKIMPYMNLVITMVIGGLWHGPSWTFVIWGLWHGLGLAGFRGWQAITSNKPSTGLLRIASIFLTVQFVCAGWVFFRASSFDNAVEIFDRIFSGTISFVNVSPGVALILSIAVLSHYLPKRWLDWSSDLYSRSPFFVQAGAMALLVISFQYLSATGSTPFLYNRF
jgi:D-alanyl-lipoteichoic acid acyltransferase DltB (MBOAT superfamily)